MSVWARLVLGAIVALLGTSCDEVPPTDPGPDAAESGTLDDEVPLTIYLRTGSSEEAMLQPVTREVPAAGNLTYRAVELLMQGPVQGEDLEAPWPAGTQVLSVSVREGVATVDLAGDALATGNAPGNPHLEALALAALANTLTEFPTIERVRLLIDGEPPESSDVVTTFWGGWELPLLLARDETLIGEEGTARVPDLSDFSTDRQSVGTSDAEPVHLRSIRVRDRITYIRVVTELASAEDPDTSAGEFPRTYARTRSDELVLEITGVDSFDAESMPSALDPALEPYLRDVRVSDGQRPNSVRITLTPAGDQVRAIHLHTGGSPSRIILDIQK